MTPGRTGCDEAVGLLRVEELAPLVDLMGLLVLCCCCWWSDSGRSRSREDSLLLLLGIVISSDGSSCVDGPPIAFGTIKSDEATLLGLFVV